MTYVIEHIARALKAARGGKGLSQRALSRMAGVPQGHISKIENGAVDLRLSSLIELARVLDLEVTLVPRKAVPAVQLVIRSATPRGLVRESETVRQAQKELTRMRDALSGVKQAQPAARELVQLQRHLRDLRHFQFSLSDLEKLRKIHRELESFLKHTGNQNALGRSLSQLRDLRNDLAQSSARMPPIESTRPAYSLDEDNDG